MTDKWSKLKQELGLAFSKHLQEQKLQYQLNPPPVGSSLFDDKIVAAQAFIKPLMRPMHYTLRGKLLAYSMGIQVDISDEEWKQAEELGFVEPPDSK